MPPDLPTRLGRQWCAYCRGGRRPDPVNDHHYHGAIADAVRKALEEAEKRAKLLEKALGYFAICENQVKVPDIQHGGFLETRDCGYCRGCGVIAALREGR